MDPAQPSPSFSLLSESGTDHEKAQVTENVAFMGLGRDAYDLEKHDLMLKTKIRVLRFIARLAATVIAATTAAQESQTLADYLQTEDIHRETVQGYRTPWAADTQLWPAIVLLSISIITVIFGLIIMAAYLHSIRRANAISTVQSWFIYVIETVHIGLWIIVGILYRIGKNGKDLWGWACSPVAAKIQPGFDGVVDFGKVCSRGDSSWHLALASASLQLLTGIIFYFVYQRRKSKKGLKKRAALNDI